MKLVVNPHEETVVKRIYSMFLEGYSYVKIIDYLNAAGFRTKAGKPFGKNSIHNILQNEKYIGTYIFNRSVPKNIDGKCNHHASKEEEDIIRIDGGVPAIISKEQINVLHKHVQEECDRKERQRINEQNEAVRRLNRCYIATAVYGSYDAPEVLVLRHFRDETLSKSRRGRLFIKTYYRLSPPVARHLKNMRRLNAIVRRGLDKIVAHLSGD